MRWEYTFDSLCLSSLKGDSEIYDYMKILGES